MTQHKLNVLALDTVTDRAIARSQMMAQLVRRSHGGSQSRSTMRAHEITGMHVQHPDRRDLDGADRHRVRGEWSVAFPPFTIPMFASWSILRRHRDSIREGRLARLPDLIHPLVILFPGTLIVLIGTVLLGIVIFWIASQAPRPG